MARFPKSHDDSSATGIAKRTRSTKAHRDELARSNDRVLAAIGRNSALRTQMDDQRKRSRARENLLLEENKKKAQKIEALEATVQALNDEVGAAHLRELTLSVAVLKMCKSGGVDVEAIGRQIAAQQIPLPAQTQGQLPTL
jgi:hypothetical protein